MYLADVVSSKRVSRFSPLSWKTLDVNSAKLPTFHKTAKDHLAHPSPLPAKTRLNWLRRTPTFVTKMQTFADSCIPTEPLTATRPLPHRTESRTPLGQRSSLSRLALPTLNQAGLAARHPDVTGDLVEMSDRHTRTACLRLPMDPARQAPAPPTLLRSTTLARCTRDLDRGSCRRAQHLERPRTCSPTPVAWTRGTLARLCVTRRSRACTAPLPHTRSRATTFRNRTLTLTPLETTDTTR
jgi:hypothetical protein